VITGLNHCGQLFRFLSFSSSLPSIFFPFNKYSYVCLLPYSLVILMDSSFCEKTCMLDFFLLKYIRLAILLDLPLLNQLYLLDILFNFIIIKNVSSR
jgi:hypothetical protein